MVGEEGIYRLDGHEDGDTRGSWKARLTQVGNSRVGDRCLRQQLQIELFDDFHIGVIGLTAA